MVLKKQRVQKNLFFDVPLACGDGKGLAMAEKITKGQEKHGPLFYVDFDWIEKGDYRPIEVLNVHGLPGE